MRFVKTIILLSLTLCFVSAKAEDSKSTSVFDLSLEELLNVTLHPAASLTRAEKHLTPASVTKITREQIDRSGARSLDELLEIYVPSFQIMLKGNSPSIGMRGIISDRNGKVLLLVNGRPMNTRGLWGAVSERMLSMLGDINYIEVVRGPGSAIYGPGAIAGVVNIVTLSGKTFEGTDVRVRQGFVEEFSNVEIRYGQKLDDDSSLFLYYGIDKYIGADLDDSRMYFSSDFTTFTGQEITALEKAQLDVTPHRESFRQAKRHKLHMNYNNGGLDAWLRYTKGGESSIETQTKMMKEDPDTLRDEGIGYQQITLAASYNQELNDEISMNYLLSYDLNDFERDVFIQRPMNAAREDEYHAQILMNWIPNEQHMMAMGMQYSYEIFGKKSPGYPGTQARYGPRLPVDGEVMEDWSTDTFSLLAEYQWNISSAFSMFFGGRADEHTYTDWLLSPRAAAIYSLSDKDTLKCIYNRSVRRADDGDIRALVLMNNDEGETEEVDSYELRFERRQSDKIFFALSSYYSDYEVIAWTYSAERSTILGTLELYGFDAEMVYEADASRIIFSHNYTKESDFTLADSSLDKQNVSASPYGFGDDLANWSDHNTKLAVEYDVSEDWMFSTSLRYLWGYPGAEDLAEYNKAVLGDNSNFPLTDGSDKAWQESVFLNIGIQCASIENTTIRLDAHNVLGLFDEHLNKRNSFQRTTQWRNEAAAASLTLERSF